MTGLWLYGWLFNVYMDDMDGVVREVNVEGSWKRAGTAECGWWPV